MEATNIITEIWEVYGVNSGSGTSFYDVFWPKRYFVPTKRWTMGEAAVEDAVRPGQRAPRRRARGDLR
jgi:hypothetical protein